MKILFVSSLVFRKASSASIRNVGLIEGLLQLGHDVEVFTIDYPSKSIDEYLVNKLSDEIKVTSVRLPILYKYLESISNNNKPSQSQLKSNKIIQLTKNIYNHFFSFPDIDAEWIKHIPENIYNGQYDLIISSSDTKTSHFIAHKIEKKISDIDWVQIWGDPWAADINLSSQKKHRIEKNEKKLLYAAKKVYYVSEPTMDDMKQKFPDISDKISFVGRSYLEEVNGVELGISDHWKFLYTGNITSYRNLDNLFNAINNYNNTYNKKIFFEIYGIVSEEVKQKIETIDFITYHNPIPFSQVLEEYKNCDVLVYVDNGNKSSQIPGKIYDYFGTDRPIFSIVDSIDVPTAKFISSFNRVTILENNKNMEIPNLSNLHKSFPVQEFSTINTARKMIDDLV